MNHRQCVWSAHALWYKYSVVVYTYHTHSIHHHTHTHTHTHTHIYTHTVSSPPPPHTPFTDDVSSQPPLPEDDQAHSPDLVSVSTYYSRELVSYVRKVQEIMVCV